MSRSITGVSGSGKSTLVHNVIYPLAAGALQQRDEPSETRTGAGDSGRSDPKMTCRRVEGAERMQRS